MSRSAANAKGDAIGICRHYFSCTLFRKVGNETRFKHIKIIEIKLKIILIEACS